MGSHRHVGYPVQSDLISPAHDPERTLPTLPAHSSSFINDPSSSVGVQGIPRLTPSFSNTRTAAPTAGISAGQLLHGTIACPHESLAQPIRDIERLGRRTTIEILPEDTLLEIFDFYRLDAMKQTRAHVRPWKWNRLAHVCRIWRHVVSVSPRRLDLRILCESGAPIGSILDSWPTLPLVIRYSARSQESTRMPKNVVVALRRPDRICEINLDVTRSMTGPIVEMVSKPCQVLERIRITVKDATRPSILIRDAFLGGSAPHLREIELDGISFPFLEIRRVLLSTDNLIELHLSNITRAARFSPDDLVTSLSTLVQLNSLTVGFHSPYFSPPSNTTRRPPQFTTLSSLESFYFHGTSDYLEDFVSQIDSPALRHITLRLFMLFYLEPPQFNQFIPHQNALQSPTRLRISHSVELVSISFFLEAEHTSRICSFETSCPRLEFQLLFATQILGSLSPLLSSPGWTALPLK